MDKTILRNIEVSYSDENTYIVKTPPDESYKISTERFKKLSAEFNRRKKEQKTAGWLCVLLGFLGVHRYYVGDYLKGFLLSGTFGGFLFGWLLDYFFIRVRVAEYNRDLLAKLAAQAIEDTRKDKEHKFTEVALNT